MTSLTLRNLIGYRRELKGWSGRHLSHVIGYSDSYINKVEAGIVEPSFDAFSRIAVALDFTDQEILFITRKQFVRRGRNEI
jgi:transcriptional regulator with XRE-family HTH domain